LAQNLDTIAALATAPGIGGIGIVRISGLNVAEVVLSIIGRDLSPRHATFSAFHDIDGSVIDRGIAIYFPGPNSYTGEDILELHGHGGSAVLQLLLRRCINAGARIALPGEFTQRAYINNKLDLVQAESIADLINATSEQAARCATRSLEGGFSKAINKLIKDLIDLRMRIEAGLDFPEEDIDPNEKEYSEKKLNFIIEDLEAVFKSAKQGSILREGAHIALVGQPNVGKSSLLNRLSGEETALVSEIAGTTRDAIRQEINIQGIALHIIDTAGLRESQDVVERMGMDRTKDIINKVDAVVVLTAVNLDCDENNRKIVELIPESIPKLYVINKIDLVNQDARSEIIDGDTYIYLSAKNDDGIDFLRSKILTLLNWHGESGVYMARERHLEALVQAKEILLRAGKQLKHPELFAEDLRLTQEALSKITGEYTSDDLLGEIFSRFCIGK
jgi:tRNA modification GTPase